jgi:hypothetical protein
MPLSQYQINEFRKRARIAGLSDDEIRQEIENKARELDSRNFAPTTNVKPAGSGAPNQQFQVNGSSSPTTQSDGSFTNDFISGLVQPSVQAQNEPKSIEGFAGNIGKSLVRNATDIGKSLINIVNPDMDQNTIANIAKLGIDATKLAAGDESETNKARQLVQFYKKRYGEDLEKTLYEDPVGVLLDISTVLSGTGAVVKGVGELGKVSALSEAGRGMEALATATDPIAQASKVVTAPLKYIKVPEKVAQTTEGIRSSISEELARRSLKANPSQMERFQELIGTADETGDIGKWMTENNIYTKEDVMKQLKEVQEQYNKKVRTDTAINPQEFADALKKKAAEIESSDISPSATQIAEKLRAEADRVSNLGKSVKKNNITDTIITNSKTSSFGKVSQKAMSDPITENFNKAYGETGLQLLDEKAPGSAKIGKKLQILREFDDIVSRQRNLGKGAQLINIFKPAFAGLTSGFIFGSTVPGGNVPGAILGGTIAGITTNPYVQRSAAKMLTEGVEMSNGIKSVAGGGASNALNIAKTGRTTLAPDNKAEESKIEDNKKNNNDSISKLDMQSPDLQGYQGNSYQKSIPQSGNLRKEAVQGLMSQGINDPHAILELLNNDESGKKVGDFTMTEVLGYQEEASQVNQNQSMIASKQDSVIPSQLKPFGSLSKKQVLALALSHGAKKSDLDDIGSMYDLFATDNSTVSEDNMKIADGLRTEYFKRTQENGYLEASQGYEKVKSTSDSAAGDLSLIYGYMKMLDPGSVVRQNEQSMAQNAGAFGDKVQNAVTQVINGKQLTPAQREAFRQEADKVFSIYKSKQANIDSFYQGYAMKLGVDPSLLAIGLYQ